EAGAHIGHGAVVHGARIGANALIGMNAVVMDNAVIGAGSIIGALTFVPQDMVIPERSVAVGNPARVVKAVSDEMLRWKSEGTALYQQLPDAMRATWRAVEPLREVPADRPTQSAVLKSWTETRTT
ncbi:MAG: gamma carbonic anhydrase family protein, partial [Gemmatimonadota bacterium]|nr:gamma carbonic anhydrase family protein [Gemmatimonadota bacterium]